MKILSLFNHKGGVSKTTTAFNIGWMLAEQGHKILLVDADPQCNLTAMVLGYNAIDNLDTFYANNPGCDFYAGIKPVLDGSLTRLQPATPTTTPNPNLFLLCGNIELAEIETQMSVALSASTALPAIRNIPGSPGALLRETAIAHEFEYVIVDMSPSVGVLNECILMSSDYFIIPTFPDFFCSQAIGSMSNVIPRWNAEINPFRNIELVYPIPPKPPIFMGFISQKYRPRSGAPAKSFQRWIDIIRDRVTTQLIPALSPLKMAIPEATFNHCIGSGEPFNMANISDFNSLIALSQKFSIPVFALTDAQLEQGGMVLENMKASRENFKKDFQELSQGFHRLALANP